MRRILFFLTLFFMISAWMHPAQNNLKSLSQMDIWTGINSMPGLDPALAFAYKTPAVNFKGSRDPVCGSMGRHGDGPLVVLESKRSAGGYPIWQFPMGSSPGGLRPVAAGPGKGADRKSSVREVYEVSGMATVVKEVSRHYLSGLAQIQDRLPPELYSALRQAGLEAYDWKRLERIILSSLEESFDAALLQEVMGWLKSPLGRKITALENEASTPDAMLKLERYAKELQKNPPSKSRLELEERIEKAVRASEQCAEVFLLSFLGAAMGQSALVPHEERLRADQIRKWLAEQHPQILQNCREFQRLLFLYTYQSLSDVEISRYVAFAESESGRKYHEKTFAAFKAAMAEASAENGKRVLEILKDYDEKRGI